jgi:hypothetical protein
MEDKKAKGGAKRGRYVVISLLIILALGTLYFFRHKNETDEIVLLDKGQHYNVR